VVKNLGIIILKVITQSLTIECSKVDLRMTTKIVREGVLTTR